MDLTTKENKHQIFKKNNTPNKNKTTKLIANTEEDVASHKLMVRGHKRSVMEQI